MTVLFTDIVSSTELLDREGVAMSERTRHWLKDTTEHFVTTSGGRLVKDTGDGALAVFASARAGVEAGLALQRALERGRPDGVAPIEIRVGIHAGEAMTTEADGDVHGPVVVVAKRIVDIATPGEVLCTDLVQALVGRGFGFAFEEQGSHLLKGFSEPFRLVAVRVAENDASTVADRAMPAFLVAAGSATFVGRDQELSRIESLRSVVASGRRRLVVIEGEPGIGKTTLAARAAADGEGVVLGGRCDERASAPFQPIVEAVREALQRVAGAAGGRLALTIRAELARIIPEIAVRTQPRPTVGDDPELDRYLLFDAVSTFVRAAAVEPAVLVIDDAQWAGEGTCELLRYLLTAGDDMPLLVLATARDTETGTAFERLTFDLGRRALVERITLAGLTVDDVASLAAAVATEAVTDLQVRTGGNPLYITQLLATASQGLDTNGITDAVGERVARISPAAQRAVAAASVGGRVNDLRLLRTVLESDGATEALRDVDEVVAAGLLVEEEAARAPSVRFVHDVVREVVHDSLGPAQRRRLHDQFADAIEAAHGTAPGPSSSALAHHRLEGLAPVDVVVAATRAAASHAASASAFEGAATFLERGKAHAVAADADASLIAELTVEQGAALRDAGRAVAAAAVGREAIELGGSLGDVEIETKGWLLVAGHGGQMGRADAELARDLAELATRDGLTDVLRVEVLRRLSLEQSGAADRDSAIRSAQAAVQLADSIGEVRTRCRARQALHIALVGPDFLDERLALADEMCELAAVAERGRPAQLTYGAAKDAAHDRLEAGEVAVAERLLAQARQVTEGPHEERLSWTQRLGESALALSRGDLATAERCAQEALEIGMAAEVPNALVGYATQLFAIRQAQGRTAELRPMLARSADPTLQPVPLQAVVGAYVGADGAEEVTPDLIRSAPRDPLWFGVVALSAEIAARTRDKALGDALEELLAPFADRTFVAAAGGLVLGSGHRFLGAAALGCGNLDAAIDHLERGIDADTARGSRLSALLGSYWLAQALSLRASGDDVARADAMRAEVEKAAAELGIVLALPGE